MEGWWENTSAALWGVHGESRKADEAERRLPEDVAEDYRVETVNRRLVYPFLGRPDGVKLTQARHSGPPPSD